jgi:hypothetical protein
MAIRKTKNVFVFGSNESGMHGGGAAKTAYLYHGARWKFSYGHEGNSFAIPTKNQQLRTLGLETINSYVEGFIAYAEGHPELEFKVTRIGCGLAGLADKDMALMFRHAPENCSFDTAWQQYLPDKKFWGTFEE